MDHIVLVITSAPYGLEGSFGCLYLSFPILAKKMCVDVLLVGDGVYCGLKGQKAAIIDYPNVSELLENISLLDGNVYVEKESCKERGVREAELLPNVEVVGRDKVVQILIASDGNIIF